MTTNMVTPTDIAELCAIIRDAGRDGMPAELRGGGTKADIGQPDRQALIVEMSAFAGIIDYDPAELVLTVGAGTRLSEIELLLAEQGQMLAFDPFDYGPVFARSSGASTIGGIIAAGVSGSRRLSAGAARDHMLGFEAVSGRGEAFIGGGKVMKNVTGYDLPKLMTGNWGRLAALTSLTVKVMPRPQTCATLLLRGLDDEAAIAAMARAMGSPAEVACAAHLPEAGITLLRVEGFAPSVAARSDMLRALLGQADLLADGADEPLWATVRGGGALQGEAVLWRISTAPSRGPEVFRALQHLGARRCYDWAGGLVWLSLPQDADQHRVRQVIAQTGGHATLIRAPAALRTSMSALHVEEPGVAALSARVRAAFDPLGILSPDRFGAAHAH
ncbi:FAD-binding protein [Sphingobium sp. B12D2B]|uniref:FAD-binding protein n=1 Tax=Sphingobium sp. B12D2B TaxID=2940577 RepID=UPI00222404E0|nr:FAD-binding protein [Sphingobium sp. B12D2B]MCW2350461.1 glycolate oxidase FAD binding subunit [Sphingobium sp. B12D2B]